MAGRGAPRPSPHADSDRVAGAPEGRVLRHLSDATLLPAPAAGQRAGRRRAIVVLGGLAAVLVIAVLASLFSAGSEYIPPGTVLALALQWLPGHLVPHLWTPEQAAIVLDYRLPKALTAVLAGAALTAAGTTFQGIFRNPLADPAVVGVSSGAALGAIVAMLFPLDAAYFGFSLVSLAAFAGAMLAVVGVFALARAGGRLPVTTLLLAGFAVSATLNAVTSLVMSLTSNGRLEGMFFWLLGGIGMSTPDQLTVAAVLICAGMAPLWAMGRSLNALALGDEGAMYLGLNPARVRVVLVACAALVAAVAVALCGIIGFVGLVVPHMARLILGPDNRLLLPAATLLGAIFLTVVDNLAVVLLSPFIATELPIGVITALIGAPVFLLLLRRRGAYAF